VGTWSELTPRPFTTIPARLGSRYGGLTCPDELRMLSLPEDFIFEVVEVSKALGISVLNHLEAWRKWESPSVFQERIRANLDRAPCDRDLPDFSYAVWQLLPRYAKRKLTEVRGLPIGWIWSLVSMYLDTPADEIRKRIPQMFPLVKRREAMGFLSDVLASFWYVGQQIDFTLAESKENNDICSLSIQAPEQTSAALDEGSTVLHLTLATVGREGLVVPRPRNIDHLMQLRQSKHVRDFRHALWRWVAEIRQGRVSASEKVRSEVEKTNRALGRLESSQKMADWMLFLSVPSLVIDALIGLPALGSLLAASSLGMKFVGSRLQKQSNWALLLRGR